MMMAHPSTLLFLLQVLLVRSSGECVIVNTSLGSIEGLTIETSNGFQINAFTGIPYAKPPIVELRFEKPVPVEPWTTTLKATRWANRCFYLRSKDDDINPNPTSEDCLYLNIFGPNATSPEFPHGYPVMFWVHGGGFVVGSAKEYDIPEGLIAKNVIFVSIQYRLSLLGFFALEHGMGNLGLWDQTMALQWVKDNIGAFGGDPSRITVFGESAGAASASILSISPHSSGLFQNVIAMSGAATNDWAVRTGKRKGDMVNFCGKVAALLDCTGTSREILDCLRMIPADKIEEAHMKIINSQKRKGLLDLFCTVGPVLDGDFFPTDVETLLKDAPRMPTMAGVLDMEGYVLSLPFFPVKMHYLIENFDSFNLKNFEDKTVALLMEQNYINIELIRRLVVHEFLDSKRDRNDTNFLIRQWTEVLGDWLITREVVNENLARTNLGYPIWFYNFEHFNPFSVPLEYRFDGMAAFHAGELAYIFGKPVFNFPFEFDENDKKMVDLAQKFWTNFAKYSNPTPEPVDGVMWNRSTQEHPLQYLKIKPYLEMTNKSYRKDMVIFWNSLVSDIEKIDLTCKGCISLGILYNCKLAVLFCVITLFCTDL